jgi:molybdate transport system permease protein
VTWAPFILSVQVATLATLLSSTVGMGIGLLLATRRFLGRDLLDAITTAPLVMPPTVLGYYVLVVLGRNSFLGQAWESLFGSSLVFTRSGAVLAATIGSLPLVIKSARAALESVDETLVLAARTLGAGRIRALFTVHLPLAQRGLWAGCMLAFARALGDFGITLMVAGNIPGETQTAALAIYDAVVAHHDAQALAMAILLTTIAILVLYTVNKLTGSRDA